MQSRICHVVLFCLDPARMAATLPEPELKKHLQTIRDTVPGVIEVNLGPTASNLYPGYTDCSNGYTHCLVSKHTDAAALHVYAGHPGHTGLAELLKAASTKPPIRIDFALDN